MCELLIRLIDKDKAPADRPDIDCQRSRRGDVITVVSDGHEWSDAERTSPEWMIVKAPGMPEHEGRAAHSGEPDDGTRKRYRWRRQFFLDLDKMPSEVATSLAHPRTKESVTIPMAAIRVAKSRRPPYRDPDIIG